MSSLVPGFEHDVFVSYATIDDYPAGDEWVTEFVTLLRKRLDAAYGRRDEKRVWWDRSDINEEAPFTQGISDTIRKSACLVVILSRGYVASNWCRAEREAFREAFANQPDRDSRIFLIDIGNLREADWPDEFKDTRGRHFWVQPPSSESPDDRQTLAAPAPLSHPDFNEFYSKVDSLAKDIHSRIVKLRDAVASEAGLRVPESAYHRALNDRNDRQILTDHPLTNGTPPEWASEWGHDGFGPWCSFDVDGIQQRLRWIPPGQFQMGVAEEFEGLFDDDGPRHWVTLTRGFWMFETKCSLKLFNAVMQGSAQAVASDDGFAVNLPYGTVRAFCDRLTQILGGVTVTLPSDAQWEFACRAGRQDGPEFDREDETEEIPNPWGLWGMLSGTGECCSDGPRLHSDQPAVDPLGNEEGVVVRGLPRSVPGGLLYYGQQTVDEESTSDVDGETHPSFREIVEPNSASSNVGFRCVIAG